MIKGSCHCGAVAIEVAEKPAALIDCNCSICRRNAALWAIYSSGSVTIIALPQRTDDYIWGAKTIKTVRCRICGCVTHWESLDNSGKVGVNFRNFAPDMIAEIPIRRFDGAESWTYKDD